MIGARYLVEHARRDPVGMVALAIAVLLSGLLPAATVLALERALTATLASDLTTAARWSAGFVAVVAVSGGLHVARTWLLKRVAFGLAARLRRALHRGLLRDEGPAATGARVAALTTQVDEVQYALTGWVGLVRDPWTVIALLLTAGWLAPGLIGWAALAVPPLIGILWFGGWIAARASRRWVGARAALSALVTEQLLGAEALRTYGVLAAEEARFGALVEAERRARVWRDTTAVLPSALSQTVAGVAVAGLLVLGAAELAAGRLDGGALAAFAAAIALLVRPVARLTEVHSHLRRADAALEGVQRSVRADDGEERAEDSADGGAQGSSGVGSDGFGSAEVQLEAARAEPITSGWVGPAEASLRGGRVAFDDAVLDLPDVHAAPGQIVALAGPTGAGKTTALRALGGAVALAAGEARLAGRDPRSLPQDLRARWIASVAQRPVLFARSVRENITLGRPLSEEAVRSALERAGAGFAFDLPQGLDTRVGEVGSRLSGGEGQRLALARALAGDPRILLLDEPTSHVDEATRDVLLTALQALRGQVTIVLATHDPVVANIACRRVEVGVAE